MRLNSSAAAGTHTRTRDTSLAWPAADTGAGDPRALHPADFRMTPLVILFIILKYSFPSISNAIVSVIETKQQIFTRNAKLNISKRVYLCTCTKGCQNKTTEWKCVVLAKYDRKRRVFCVRLRKHSSMVTVLIRLEVRA